MVNGLALKCGNEIPFPQAGISIHQPTLEEIGFLENGENDFYLGCEMLTFTKNKLTLEGKKVLEKYSNFDIVMTILGQQTDAAKKNRICFFEVLSLIFPLYDIKPAINELQLINRNNQDDIKSLNGGNFDALQKNIIEMFCLSTDEKKEYNPKGDLAAQIAAKIQKGRAKANEQKGEQEIKVLQHQMDVLSVGNHLSLNELKKYTVWQLFCNYRRFIAKYEYDLFIKAKMAGGKNLKEVPPWVNDLDAEQKQDKLKPGVIK